MRRVKCVITISIIICICIYVSLLFIKKKNDSILVEKKENRIVELNIDRYVKVNAKDTNGYKIEQLETRKDFWVANSEHGLKWCCEKFGIDQQEIEYEFDFDKYEYIFVYGYRLKYLNVNQSDYRGWGYMAEYDVIEDEPFMLNTVYIYEVKKTGVWDTEFM